MFVSGSGMAARFRGRFVLVSCRLWVGWLWGRYGAEGGRWDRTVCGIGPAGFGKCWGVFSAGPGWFQVANMWGGLCDGLASVGGDRVVSLFVSGSGMAARFRGKFVLVSCRLWVGWLWGRYGAEGGRWDRTVCGIGPAWFSKCGAPPGAILIPPPT